MANTHTTPRMRHLVCREVQPVKWTMGIVVVESWLMSATEYIAIDNTPPRPGVHVDGRSGMARPDQSAGHAKLKSQQTLFR